MNIFMSQSLLGNPYIVFPSDLLELEGPIAYPQIAFTVQEDKAGGNRFTTIYLPMPGGVSFTDAGTYGTMDLGDIAASGGVDALAAVMAGERGALDSAAGSVKQIGKSIAGGKGKQILATAVAGIDKETAMFAQKKIKAPNQNTTFTGNNMRAFTFQFKLIAVSERDTLAIARIQRTFRRYTYAGSSDDAPNIVLDYPPLWKIQFLEGGRENAYLPKIFACYLESSQCTFNEDANMFRRDGSPFSVDCTVSFKETRTLTRNDIDLLEMDKSDRGISLKTGLATSTAPSGIKLPMNPYNENLPTPPPSNDKNRPANTPGSGRFALP